MRHFIAVFAAALVFGLGIQAQETRTVIGLVADENGQPVPGVILKVEGVDDTFKAGGNGRFEIKVPISSRSILAVKDGYPPVSAEISGQFILIKMSHTTAVATTPAPKGTSSGAAVAAAGASVAATAGAVASAAAATASAGKAAKAATVASAASAAGAAAAATSAIASVVPKKDKPKPEKVEKPEKTEKPAKTEKPEKAGRPAKPEKPEVKCREKGFCQSLDISGAWTFKSGVVTCTDLGAVKYGCLIPLQGTYSIGYQFNRHVSLQAGAGFMYNVLDLCNGDVPDPAIYEGGKPRRWDVPVFASVKVMFGKRVVRPFLLFQGGVYAMTLKPCAEAGFGLRFMTGWRTGVNLVFSAVNQPWPYYTKDAFNGYPFNIAPSVKLGISF